MENLNVKQPAPCRCGGQVKVFGPCSYAPRSNWGIYCNNDDCEYMATGDSLEEAIENWNLALEPIHA
ncbi:hypothetical protein SAMN05660420_00400 [Desulfuromusa kysingii]|uniref:Restriction alleviation protein Lar n=1 Tax=Desulfuromusa kysingii TaxID=37625 RepID=A0A1H3W061_9BACT|nr:hypothetical protein [Desulfuromusa kysingii]SDZ80525.1 hypothetical protein SAMN05660420_00400 [Desulfuromusa kysingii]